MREDWRGFKGIGGDGQAPAGREADYTERFGWWMRPKGDIEVVGEISALLNYLARVQQQRLWQSKVSAALYGDVSALGYSGVGTSPMVSMAPGGTRLTYNLVRLVADAIRARICRNRPKSDFLTIGGDYKMRRRAKKLTQLVEGIFYEEHVYEKGSEAFRDACVWDWGVIKVAVVGNRVRLRRVLPGEIWIDEFEATYGVPRQMHQITPVDKDLLLAEYPDHEEGILQAATQRMPSESNRPTVADLLIVRESWRLPTSSDAHDGRHIVSTSCDVLLDEEWTRDEFPFVFLRWSSRLYGFRGQALTEQLQGLQYEMNKLLWTVSRSIQLAGTFKVFLPSGSKVPKSHINNDLGAIITGNGAPQYLVPPIVQPEIYQQIQEVERKAFASVGLSAMSATSRKEPGLNSGAALREREDIEDGRFNTIAQQYDAFYLEIARLAVDAVRDLARKNGKHYRVTCPDRKFLQQLDWADIDLDRDSYVLRCYPTSSLPSEPAGRLQTVQEFIQAGFLSPRSGRRLLDFPDLDQVETLANSDEEYLHSILEKIVDDGEYTPPESYDDLDLALELAAEYYSDGRTSGLEEEKLELLRKFMLQVGDVKAQKAAAQAPLPGTPGAPGAPQAAPMPTPQSDLIPNTPGAAPAA